MAPKRKGKKGSLHYALEACDRGKVTTIVTSSKCDLNSKESLEVMNCIRRSREVFRDNISPLQGAVTLGHFNICKHLVEEGAMLKSMSMSIPHPLCLALQKGHYDIARLLLEAGADVNLPSGDALPLSFALDNTNCDVQIVKEIIDAGFEKNGIVHLSSQRTILHSAVKMNHLTIVKYLFSISVNPNVRDKRGLSPLHYAVQKDFPAMVRLLAKHGAIIDFECLEHFTPMFYAIATGNCDMVKLLLSLGANIHHVNGSKKCSMMPLHFAANFCQFRISQLLLEKGAEVNRKVPLTGEIALHAAARADSQNIQQSKIALDCIVESLIKQGSDLNARHKYSLTPLQVAIKAKNLSVAKILITNGSKLNNGIHEEGEMCYTTFHIAAKCLDKELVKLCFDYGADCLVKDEEGLSPCHMALLTAMLDALTHSADCNQAIGTCLNNTDQLYVFKLFWKHGYPFDQTLKMKWIKNDNPPFPSKIVLMVGKQKMLFSGLKTQQLRMVQKAVQQGAEVKSCSSEIPYPLHYIASKGNESIMKIFLAKGFQPNTLDNHGETPLHIAAKAGYVDCCRLLLEYGACYNYSSPKCPSTPLDLARDNSQTEVVSLLSSVRKYFKDIKKGHLKKFKPDMKIFYAVMNCCGKDGLSLMGRSIQFNVKVLTERLMKLRLQVSSSN